MSIFKWTSMDLANNEVGNFIIVYGKRCHFDEGGLRMSLKLFSHNQSAFEEALAMLEETGKAAVVHPTGTGKSYIGFKLCEQFPEKIVCWLSPSEYIYKTQLENLKKIPTVGSQRTLSSSPMSS